MTVVKQLTRALCGMLLISIIYPDPVQASRPSMHDNTGSFLLPLAGALGAAAGICTLGYCLKWWGHESNEQVIASCKQTLHHAEQYYMFANILRSSNMLAGHTLFDEQTLYQLAFAKRGSLSIDAFLTGLASDIYHTKKICKNAEARSLELKKKANWQEARDICYELDHLHDDLYKVAKELEAVHLCMQRHSSYFNLFEHEDYVRNHYASELLLLDQHQSHETYQLKEGIRGCAFNKYKGPFALIDFVKHLKSDIQALENSIFRSAYNYAVRLGHAQDVANRLKHIEQLVLADHEYAHAMLEYQRDQREKERLALEKERIKLEQQKLSLQAREVSAREAQNSIKMVELIEHRSQYHQN